MTTPLTKYTVQSPEEAGQVEGPPAESLTNQTVYIIRGAIVVDSEEKLEIFYAQSAIYKKMQTVQAILSTLIMVSAVVLDYQPVESKFIVCEGDSWKVQKLFGEFFLFFHVVFIAASSMQT